MALEGHVLKRVFFIGDRTFSHLNLIKNNPTNREVRCGNSVLKKNWNITWRTTFLPETQEKKRKLEYHLVGVVFCRDDDFPRDCSLYFRGEQTITTNGSSQKRKIPGTCSRLASHSQFLDGLDIFLIARYPILIGLRATGG